MASPFAFSQRGESGAYVSELFPEIGKRIDPELPKLFAELPRAPYGVRAIPAHEGAGVSDRYQKPDEKPFVLANAVVFVP